MQKNVGSERYNFKLGGLVGRRKEKEEGSSACLCVWFDKMCGISW